MRVRDLLQTATAIMLEVHEGQVDKAGKPYWKHPMAVACKVFAKTMDPGTTAVALLHDVLEDSDLTSVVLQERLRMVVEGSAALAIVDAVVALTKRKGEPYEDYLGRVADDPWATEVKRSDMWHNLGRVDDLEDPDDIARLFGKYAEGLVVLNDLAPKEW